MRASLLKFVVCPQCSGPLELRVSRIDDGDILEGGLQCSLCGNYPIIDGVPRLLPAQGSIAAEARRTVDRFGAQWNDFDTIREHYEDQFLGWIRPNTKESFAGKIVLEGGCGKGRHSALVAKYKAKEVIAVDLGSAVEAARRNTRHLPNVHVIQADLHHLPIRRQAVDIAFSVGVLHHTPTPKRAFDALAETVRPGGRMIVWVYGRENNGWIVHFVDPVRRRITSRLPHRWLFHASKLPATLVYGFARSLYGYGSRDTKNALNENDTTRLYYGQYMRQLASFPFSEVHSIVHDHLTPAIAHYLPRGEVESWFKGPHFDEVQVTWHNENSWAATGVTTTRPLPEDAIEVATQSFAKPSSAHATTQRATEGPADYATHRAPEPNRHHLTP
ncbi:MAG: methyltransferase domain-containing protein [Deltaproteobacteria bacterium]|nr:methyltransferase domain-containing protein [Deltaproteobacteria bacterium]